MFKNLSSKTKIVIVTIHVVSLLIIGIIFYRLYNVGETCREELAYTYTRNIGEITEYMADIQTALTKAQYVNTATGQFAVVSAIRESASAANIAISNLPFSDNNSEKIEESLSIMADFALYIEKKISAGEDISSEDEEIFEILAQHAENIETEFLDIQNKMNNGEISFAKTQELINQTLNLPALPDFDLNIPQVSQNLSTLPTIEYDGKFSQHISSLEAVYLSDKTEITQEEAQKIASDFLGTDDLTFSYESSGTIPSYQFKSDDYSIYITKNGGEIAYLRKNVTADESKIDYTQALETAKEFVLTAGFENTTESYFSISGNICTINFVATQNDVLIYTDSLTVSVELSEGTVIEFTSEGYLMNNKTRENLQTEISLEQAKQSVKENLTILSSNLAIIPSAGLEEVLCYEFVVQDSQTNDKLIIYINSSTGLEEQIYSLSENEDGQILA